MATGGLTSAAAESRLERYGRNVLQVKQAHPWWKILFEQFQDVMVIILIVSAGISFGIEYYESASISMDAVVISFIVVLNAGIGFFQEYKTERTLEALKKMIIPEIRVIRDGEEVLLSTELIVPGDLVVLGEGDKIPADGILLDAHSLKVEEAALTGESLPIEKKKSDEVYMGTSVARGSGIFEVRTTGMATKFGNIAKLTTETEKVKSPLQKELETVGLFVTKMTFLICVVLFVFVMFRDFTIVESLMFSVSVAIAAVPEGLPTTLTVALAIGATVLFRKKAMVKRLSSVETLGAVTTICSDKTGTLTKNEMTVREVYLADRSIYHVSGVGYDPHAGKLNFVGGLKGVSENQTLLNQLLEVAQRCNEAKLIHNDIYTVLGDPTEGALLTLVQKAHMDFEGDPDEIFPFDSDRKMMSVIHDGRVLVKGSPDQLLAQCTHWSDGHKTFAMTEAKRQKIRAHYERMAQNALRVLAFASKKVESKTKIKDERDAEKNLTFLGLVGMIDPPRDEVRHAVGQCRTAGVRIVVITGDYGVTAEAIARELTIVRGKNVEVLTGDDLKHVSDHGLRKLLEDRSKSIIFARSLPEQKLRIVSILQSLGEVVAMTGDGVNDAPALKKADIGVAMGITGTEVSKEAATMVLTDDSFATIVNAIEEGRRIYDNLQKFIWFIFSCNIGELFIVFAAFLFDLPMPLTAILILCVDLGTDILPGIALGVDDADPRIMHRPPRDVSQRIMQREFVLYFLVVGCGIGLMATMGFIWTLIQNGWGWGHTIDETHLDLARTVAFTTVVMVQLVNAFSARSLYRSLFTFSPFKNTFLLISIFSSVLMVLLMLYVPTLNVLLHTAPLGGKEWGTVTLCSLLPLGVVEWYKWFLRDKHKHLSPVQ